MSHILGIKFRDHGQLYYFDSGPFVVDVGDDVLVQTEQGLGMGKVALVRDAPPEDNEGQEIKPIFRLPTPEDLDIKRENDILAREAHAYCRKCIESRALEMKLVDVEVLHDRGKIVFYFTAPGRIDFRELVKDLVKAYHTRIELRQIGVRHETQMLGAIGNCGQMCCCRRFMRKFAPVTIKMAKEQNLFLNPTKISGICGRLLCCLSFEQDNYEQFQKKCPRVGKKFSTSLGLVKVLRTNLFRETVTVLDETGEERELTVDEWSAVIESRPPQADPLGAPKLEERARTEAARPETSRPGPGSRPAARGAGRDRPRPVAQPAGRAPGEAAAPAPAESQGPAEDDRDAGSRSARRPRRPGRKPSRPPREPAGERPPKQAGPRQPHRPDGRHGGGKPSSRDPETGS
ncbi:MAG: regulatory iron-sulfur-containing complex subunit RicT [Solidesulfovibrio sp.]|uniref:regulatory iron-sulfur-containing complex subunit RicT n=2 Tax=Solidesulfovibrio sp. TaxID=2910990 RepID=UPI0031598930